MQKEFEKQVKEKMEELDFVPSTPVWSKIEAQIRQEKDRRRLLFWLPFLTLLLGGGITWFIINASPDSTLAQQEAVEKTKTVQSLPIQSPAGDYSSGKIETSGTIPADQPGSKQVYPKEIAEKNDVNLPRNNNVVKLSTAKTFHGPATKKQEAGTRENKSSAENRIGSSKKNAEIKLLPTTIKKEGGAEPKSLTPPDVKDVQEPVPQLKPAREKLPVNMVDSQARKKEFVLAITPISDDALNRLLAQVTGSAVDRASTAKTFGRSKWKFGFDIAAGISGAGDGMPINSRRNSYLSDAASNTPPPPAYLQNRSLDPSPMQNAVSFAAGMVMRKQINEKFAFATGLRYQYLSASRKVGFKVVSFSTGSSGNLSGAYSSAQYHDYMNRFHFLSVPVNLEYRPLKKIPLQVMGGLAFQHLFETNALHFNQLSRVYQKDDEQFRKNQVFAEGGLNYTFPLGKLSVSAGPHFQYSLMSLGETYKGQHFFTAGLKTKILFNN